MNTVEFLAHLRDLGIQLWAEGDRLRYRAPEGALTAELRAELAARKAAILAFLAETAGLAQASAPVIAPVARGGPLPLSFAQERLWFIDQWDPGSATYHLPQVVRLQGRLDIDALRRSLTEVVRRHEALRTTFAEDERGRPVQIIHPAADVALAVHDLRALPESERRAVEHRLAAEEATRPFDLRTGPLLRAALIRIDDAEHLLTLTLHHIVSDGWSNGLLIRELSALYAAGVRGATDGLLPPLPVQYADYAAWQRQWLAERTLDAELAYWREQLGGAPALLELPTDRPRPARQTFRGAMETALLPAALIAPLTALGQRQDATLFQTLLAAFQTLLYRYTGQPDLVVGSPVSGRSHAEIEPLIGCFVNMLALRVDLSGNPAFNELLQRVRATTLAAYAHQETPFEKVVEALQPARSFSHAPVFQVVFMLQYAAPASYQLPDLTLSPVDLEHTVAKFDLELALTETPDGLWAAVEYNTDLFDQATIARLLEHYRILLEQVIANPQTRIGALALLSAAEQEQLRTWQGAPASFPIDNSLHGRFERYAARTPDALAAVYEDQRLSYGELNARANQLAHALRARGVGRETPVALCLQRSLDLVVGVLGILKAGAAYLPLDPTYPPERIALILADAQAPALVTEAALYDQLPPLSAAAICLDRDWPAISQEPTDNPELRADPDQLAYIIYTSGSTGKPKGVLVGHGQVLRLFAATNNWFHFGSDDVWTLFHSIAFDFSVWELWGALLYGGRLVVTPYLTSRSPEAFRQLVGRERVTVLNQTPSAFQQFILADADVRDELALRYVIFGGEALDPLSLRPWFARHGDERPQLVNMYGITETTVHVTYRPLSAADLEGAAPSVIGGPIPDLQLYALDPYGQRTPIGVPGELYVGGAGLARGYLNRAALTAERFVPDPWSGQPGARLYRSGDLARYLPSGDLQYLGRIDQQVKLRGFRIELGEIEAVLQQHAAIRAALVLAREDTRVESGETNGAAFGAKRLVAYLVGADAAQPSVSELRRFLKTHLPEYMVPSAFIWLDAFPLTTNGKIDRAALPSPDQSRPALATAFSAPRTAREQALAAAWSEVLGIERIGVHDNFFSLGGDSIRSLQIVAAARAHGVEISIHQIFEHQTIAELAQMAGVSAELASAPELPIDQLSAADLAALPPHVEQAYPLAALQSGMLFHGAVSQEAALYHDRFTFDLRAPYQPEALRTALRALVARHPVLRTSFDLSSFEEPLQLVHRSAEVPLELHDLRALDPDAQQAAFAAWVAAEQQTPFDWTQPPLLRLALHRLTDETFHLTISFHHAILDGWSGALMVGELFQLYRAALGGVPHTLPPAGQSFGAFVALERQALADPAQLDYWRDLLSGSAPATIPRWGPPQPEAAQAESRLEVLIPAEVQAGLRQLSQLLTTPLKSVLLAAHLRVLSLLSGQADLVTGLIVNGRPETEHSDRTLGLFLNTIPLRVTLSGGSWADLVWAAFTAERDALPYRRYPLARLQQQLGGKPLFETAFNFAHFHVLQSLIDADEIESLGGSSFARTNFPFATHFTQDPTGGDLQLALDYDPTILRPAQVEAYGRYYAQTLAAMAADPAARYDAIELLSDDERRQLLFDWNATAAAAPPELCVHELFAAQAARTPDAIAVAAVSSAGAHEQLSYRELDQRADQLAAYLRRLSADRSDREPLIGLYMDRSPELIVAILGVLKAGAAYVPLDPTYPPERLRFMLHDAGASIVLTRARLAGQLATIAPAQACIVRLDAEWPAIAAAERPAAPARVLLDQLAYVIYTSGSTGRPKGVLVPHRGIGNLAQAQIAAFDVGPGSRVLQFAALSFDAAVAETWLALLSGATLYLAPREDLLPGPGMIELLETHAITVLKMPPSALAALPHPGEGRDLPALRTLAVAGEACPPELIARWSRPGRRMINAYGPTEVTVCATMAEDIGGEQRPPIGRPLPNTQVYVLDQRLEPVPVGVRGEVYVGGVGVARGYLGQPGLTAARFIPNPFWKDEAAQFSPHPSSLRLYKTGDLARWLPDGQLDYLGRADEQIKLRGFRIELGEIEATLQRHPAVRQCVVTVRDASDAEQDGDGEQDRRLAAYVVPLEQPGPTDDELRAFLQERLPSYMIPSAFMQLDELPRMPNDKLDRRALPELKLMPAPISGWVAPRDRWELQVAQVWQKLLQTGPVSINDDFFTLGGDSLLAVRLVARMEQEFGRQIPVATLLSAPTVADVAALLRHQPKAQEWSPLVPIQPRGGQPPLFCMHPIGGHVLCYFKLAQELGADQPVYGLQARGLEDDQPPPLSVEAMAADYISSIRTVQPHGPYYLCGWSFGGVIAFEMAQQLLRDGEQIGLLSVFDSSLIPPIAPVHTPAEELKVLAWALGGVFNKEIPLSLDELEGLSPDEMLAFLLERIQSLEVVPTDIGLPQMRRYLAVFRSVIHASHTYVPQDYPRSVLLFQAAEAPLEEQEHRAAEWSRVAGGRVIVDNVPGSHFSLMNTPEVLARRLRHELDLAFADATAPIPTPQAV